MTDNKLALVELLEKSGDTELLRDMLDFVADRLMAPETEDRCGAAPGERSPERINHRNGYRERRWETRAGTLDLFTGISIRRASSAALMPRASRSSR